MNFLKTTTFLVSAFLCSHALAISDPGFELTNPQELPLWRGAHWVKGSTVKYSAKIIESPKDAASGKRFLRVENPQKGSVYVLGYPSQNFIQGHIVRLKVKVRGNGLANIMIRPYDAKGKLRPWKAPQQSGFVRVTPDKWHDLQLDYTPVAGDVRFYIWGSVRDGQVDFDDFELTLVKSDKAVKTPAAPEKQAPAPKKKSNAAVKKNSSPHLIFSDFETWQNGLPERWKRFEGDNKTVIRTALNNSVDKERFGEYSMFLNGKIVMDPPMTKLAVPRTRPMRLSFYAKGGNGRIVAKLREGRDGFVDYLIELADESTTSEWKKYAVAFSLPNNARIDNATIELQGQNCFIDNVEFKAAFGSDGNLVYSIPIVKKVPAVDGKITPGEWDFAAGGSDPMQLFVESMRNFKPVTPAVRQQSSVRLCSDGERIYFLIETAGASHMKKDADFRDAPVYLDDAVEIHVNPEYGNASPKYSYQFIFNSKNTVFDQRRPKGGSTMNPENHKWNSKTLVNKSSIVNDVWILEGSFSLKELDLTPEKPFGLNVCVSRKNPDEEGTLNGAPFKKLDSMVKATVSCKLPALYWSKNGDWGSILATLSNAQAEAGNYFIEYDLDAEKCAVKEKKAVYLAPGRCVPVLFNVPGGAGKFGALKLTMTDSKGNIVSRNTLDFNSMISPLREEDNDLEIHVLPEQKKFAINIHNQQGKYDRMERVEISGVADKKYVFTRKDFVDFEKTLVIKRLFNIENNKNYTIAVQVLDGNGQIIDAATKKFTADFSLIPSENANLCKDILAPYTPVAVDKNILKVSMRDYQFDGSALPQQIIASGNKVLDNAVKFTAVDKNGKVLVGKPGKFKIKKAAPDKVLFYGESIFPGFTVQLNGTMEYDGAVFYKADVIAPKPVELKRLSIEVPFSRLDYFHSFVDSQLRLWMCRQPAKGSYRHPSVKVWTPETIMDPQGYRRFSLYFFPYGDGVIWSSKNIIPGVIKNGFLPYMTFGNSKFGFELFSDTDRGWIHSKNCSVHEILRQNGREIVRTNFIAVPHKIQNKMSFEFGLMATPGRKRSREERYSAFFNNAYSHSGFTDHALCGLRIKDWQLYNDQYVRLKHRMPLFVNCKGFYPQMDPVSRYMDSEWRTRPDYVFKASYKNAPSLMFGKDQRNYLPPAACYTPGRINFFGDRMREIISKVPAMPGIYWDENWMKPCNNPNHAECGYHLPDGQVQGRAWWRGIREVDRRVRQAFLDNNRPSPLIVMFTGEGLIPHAYSFGSINYLGEHTTFDMDYIDYWTPHFTEIACAGAWGFDVGILGMFREVRFRNRVELNRAQLALVKLYESHFYPIDFNMIVYRPVLNAEKRFGKTEKDVIFAGYFSEEGKHAVTGLPAEVKASLWIRPGKKALIYVSNLGNKDSKVSLKFNLADYQIKNYKVFNGENRKPIDLSKPVLIKKHDFVLFELEKAD